MASLTRSIAVACVLAAMAGCADKSAKPLAPTDDRLGSVSDLAGSAWKHEDAAAESNDATLAGIRKARQQLRQ